MSRFLSALSVLLVLAAAALPAKAADAARALRPEIAALVVSAQDKVKAMDFDGAVSDLDGALAQELSAFELGVTLTVRGGALFAVGDLQGAAADWERAIVDGDLDAATELHLANNLEQIEAVLLR